MSSPSDHWNDLGSFFQEECSYFFLNVSLVSWLWCSCSVASFVCHTTSHSIHSDYFSCWLSFIQKYSDKVPSRHFHEMSVSSHFFLPFHQLFAFVCLWLDIIACFFTFKISSRIISVILLQHKCLTPCEASSSKTDHSRGHSFSSLSMVLIALFSFDKEGGNHGTHYSWWCLRMNGSVDDDLRYN